MFPIIEVKIKAGTGENEVKGFCVYEDGEFTGSSDAERSNLINK